MATALIQMGRAAGFKVWATTRSEEGRKIALRLGADAVFSINEELPQRVEAAVDNVGAVTWAHSLRSLKRGGTIVVNGVTTGSIAETDLLRIFVEQIDIRGTIMGMKAMMSFIITAGIQPEVGAATSVGPMDETDRSKDR